MSDWRRRVTINGGILALFAVLAAVMTFPLAARLNQIVLGPPGDNFEYVQKMWWFKEALFVRGVSPFFNPDVFAPFGYPVALSETTLANTVLGLPVTAGFGEVVSYNVALLMSFVLSGFAGYLLGFSVSRRRFAGLIAGTIFAFAPYRFAHLGAGHLPLMGTQWIPLTVLYLERLIRTKRPHDSALAGFFFGLAALSSWYYAYMIGLFIPIYVALRVHSWRNRKSAVELGYGLLLMAVIAGLVVVPALVPLLRTTGRQAAAYPLRYVDQWSASPLDFLMPNIMHPLWGRTVAERYPQNVFENMLFVGWLPVALAWLGWRRWQVAGRVYGRLAAVASLLALGTTLHFWAGPVHLPVPDGPRLLFERGMHWLTTRSALNPIQWDMGVPGAIVVPLPTLLLYLFLPFFNAMRVWARFGLIVILAVAVLAGLGTATLTRYRHGRIIAALVWAGILIEFAPMPFALGYSYVQPQPVDRWLAGQPGSGLVIQFPLDRTWYGYPLYEARWHGKPVAYGYGTFVPQRYREDAGPLAGFPDVDSMNLLREWGVRYIVIARDSLGDRAPAVLDALDRNLALRLAWQGQDQTIYAGDRVLRALPVTPIVPPSEFLYGSKQAYLQDTLFVYEIRQ